MSSNQYWSAKDMPTRWYNLKAEFPQFSVPSINAETGKPVTEDDLKDLFAEGLIDQEFNYSDMFIDIPDDLLKYYSIWRSTPLVRAARLEEYLGTKCRILYKYEGVSPIGSHKANSAIAQAYFTKKAGLRRVVAETGAGQWGSAISMAASFFGLDCTVFMVQNSYNAKPARRTMMQTFGSKVLSSPSNVTEVARRALEADPNFQGGIGTAIAEAVESAASDADTAYALGSCFDFVCMHQTISGLELKNQLDALEISPNYIICCIGGGSSYAGITFPYLREKLNNGLDVELIAVESNAVPSVSKGLYTYDHGDSSRLTPLLKMYTLGHEFAAPHIHSGGLRYHGLSSTVSSVLNSNNGTIRAYSQLDVFEAAMLFAKLEGYIPAPEAAHGIKAAMDIARDNADQEKTIVFSLTGHGFFDLAGYDAYLQGTMPDSDTPDSEIAESLQKLREAVRF